MDATDDDNDDGKNPLLVNTLMIPSDGGIDPNKYFSTSLESSYPFPTMIFGNNASKGNNSKKAIFKNSNLEEDDNCMTLSWLPSLSLATTEAEKQQQQQQQQAILESDILVTTDDDEDHQDKGNDTDIDEGDIDLQHGNVEGDHHMPDKCRVASGKPGKAGSSMTINTTITATSNNSVLQQQSIPNSPATTPGRSPSCGDANLPLLDLMSDFPSPGRDVL